MKYCWKSESQRKSQENQEKVEEIENKETHDLDGKEFSSSGEALLIFEVKHYRQYMKVAAGIQNAVQCYHVICDESFPSKQSW